MSQETIFMKSKGGGQYFKCQGDEVKIICLYEFNPLVERTRMRPDTLGKLACDPCTESEFREAEMRVARLLDLPVALSEATNRA
ncbi:hypothetical protein [Siphonobacter sp.]|uniref:hypothetical protein n=1 Tax=Siphonobacter sp. TaxID=1869184 RepID=UPI003B3B4439